MLANTAQCESMSGRDTDLGVIYKGLVDTPSNQKVPPISLQRYREGRRKEQREGERRERRQRGRERKREGKLKGAIKGARVREETDERREIQRKPGERTLRWTLWEDGERDQEAFLKSEADLSNIVDRKEETPEESDWSSSCWVSWVRWEF